MGRITIKEEGIFRRPASQFIIAKTSAGYTLQMTTVMPAAAEDADFEDAAAVPSGESLIVSGAKAEMYFRLKDNVDTVEITY